MRAEGVIHSNRVGPTIAVRFRHLPAIAVVLVAGAALRVVLAFVLAPGQGFATDLGQFASWAQAIGAVGPGAFYESARGANYPPGYIDVLWVVDALSGWVASIAGVSSASVLAVLLKLPAVLADLAIGVLLYRAGRRWFGERRGVLAAALYLFIPVTWYDSSLWGQVDAVAALVMLGELILLIDGWPELAAMTGVLAMLVKPQGVVVLAVIAPVLLRRHLLRPGSGPTPALQPGSLAARLDPALDGWLTRRVGPERLASSFLLSLVLAIIVTFPYDLPALAPSTVADLPVIGHLVGFLSLFSDTAGQYAVLTANAFNAWALVGAGGAASLAANAGAGSGGWIADSVPVLGGLSAFTVGATLLAATALLVFTGLLLREDRLLILLGFTVVAFAFYALPTRVHERYLFPVFASGALLTASAAWVGWYVVLGLLNAVNLHAVLTDSGGGGFGGGGRGGAGFGGGGPGGGGAFAGGPGGGLGGFGGAGIGSVQLPFGDIARADIVVAAVAVGQTALFVALLAAFAWRVLGGLRGRPQEAGATS
jgi:hypothetical protein